MQQDAPTVQRTLQNLRILHGTMLLCIPMYLFAMSMVPAQTAATLSPTLYWVLGALGVENLAVGQWMRSKRLRPAFETLRTIPDDPKALAGWRQGVIIGDSLAMAVVLYGLVIHYLGGSTEQVAPFFVGGAAAMLLWWPREP